MYFSRIKCTKRYFVINSSIVCRRRLKTKNIYHYQPNKCLIVSSSLMSVLKRVFQDEKTPLSKSFWLATSRSGCTETSMTQPSPLNVRLNECEYPWIIFFKIWIPTIFLMENEKNSLIFLFYEKEFKPAHSARDTEKVTFSP